MDIKKGRFSFWYGTLAVLLLGLPACMGTNNRAAMVCPASYDLSLLENKSPVYAVAIIGSGPAGLMAGVYAGRGKAKTIVLMGSMPGGLLTQTSHVENWPGFESILGKEVIQRTMGQARRFHAELSEDAAEKIDFSSWPYKITTEEGKTIYAMTVIIATGASPRKLEIPGETEYWGRGVTTCAVCDAPFYKDKEVVVIGGGDSAVEEAIQLARYAKKITILVRKDKMRAAPSMQQLLKGYPHISVLYNIEPREVKGDGNEVTSVALYNSQTKQSEDYPASGVFLAIGHIPNSRIVKGKVPVDEHGYILLEGRTQQTPLKGLYAAGDVTDHRYRQAGYAAGQGIAAALDALAFLNEIGFNTEVAARMGIISEQAAEIEVKTVAELADAVANVPVALVNFGSSHSSSVELDSFIDLPEVKLIKVDIEKARDIAKKYYVFEEPVVLIFKNGTMVGRFNQLVQKAQLKALLADFEHSAPIEEPLVRA
jgi:thioredoxin reductase (NADPH)